MQKCNPYQGHRNSRLPLHLPEKKWSRAILKKSGVQKEGCMWLKKHVTFKFDNTVQPTPTRMETPRQTSVDQVNTETALSGSDQHLVGSRPSGLIASPSTMMPAPPSSRRLSVTGQSSSTYTASPVQNAPKTDEISQPQQQETLTTSTVYKMWLCEVKEITQTVRGKDGAVIHTSVTKEEEPIKMLKETISKSVENILLADLSSSPSHSNSTMTSGDLGDVRFSFSCSSSGSRGSRQSLHDGQNI